MKKLNCAGQGCADRETCRRYVNRIPDRKVIVEDREIPIFEWASFDIERSLMGDCSNYVQARAA